MPVNLFIIADTKTQRMPSIDNKCTRCANKSKVICSGFAIFATSFTTYLADERAFIYHILAHMFVLSSNFSEQQTTELIRRIAANAFCCFIY